MWVGVRPHVSIELHMWALVGVGVHWCLLGHMGGSLGSFGWVGALVATGVLGQIGIDGCWLEFISGHWVSEMTHTGSGH